MLKLAYNFRWYFFSIFFIHLWENSDHPVWCITLYFAIVRDVLYTYTRWYGRVTRLLAEWLTMTDRFVSGGCWKAKFVIVLRRGGAVKFPKCVSLISHTHTQYIRTLTPYIPEFPPGVFAVTTIWACGGYIIQCNYIYVYVHRPE